MDDLNDKNPLDIKAQYDIVCNGVELSVAPLEILPEMAFEVAGYGKEVVEEEFSALINAFGYGAPPHAGIAPGIDRMIMLLADEPNIREVIAFPMNGRAQDLMMNAPSRIEKRHLNELAINLKESKIKNQ